MTEWYSRDSVRLIATSVKERGGAKSCQEITLASAAKEERVDPKKRRWYRRNLVLQGEDRKEAWERNSCGPGVG